MGDIGIHYATPFTLAQLLRYAQITRKWVLPQPHNVVDPLPASRRTGNMSPTPGVPRLYLQFAWCDCQPHVVR
jgi:hypothetical protein